MSPLTDITGISEVLRVPKFRLGSSCFKALSPQRKAECTQGKKELKIWSEKRV